MIDTPETPQSCCKQLRSKSMFYQPGERPGLLSVEEAMGYWCAKTNDAIGCDNGLACHGKCQPGRSCYEQAASAKGPLSV